MDPKVVEEAVERYELALLNLRTRATLIGGHSTEGQDIFKVVSKFAQATAELMNVRNDVNVALFQELERRIAKLEGSSS